MKSNVIRAVLAGTVALTMAAGCSAEAAAAPMPAAATVAAAAGFQPFWVSFRKAVLAHDIATLEAMTRFPLKAKGELDDDPPKAIGKAAFSPLLTAILKDDANVRGFHGTTQDFVQSHPAFPADQLDGGGEQRVGDLVFQQGPGGWKLTTVYQPATE